jgi:hypothetical protein
MPFVLATRSGDTLPRGTTILFAALEIATRQGHRRVQASPPFHQASHSRSLSGLARSRVLLHVWHCEH